MWSRLFSATAPGRESLSARAEEGLAPRAKGKILVVDDDLVTLKALMFKLESRGYAAIGAVDYSEAGAILRSDRPDVILLDIHFPPDVAHGGGVPWDGFRIIQWLRNFKDLGQIPIILMSGHVEPRLADRARTCGAIDLLTKPIDSTKLLDLLELCMLQKTTPGSAPFDI
jgi:CheY-like chemotaxis protein